MPNVTLSTNMDEFLTGVNPTTTGIAAADAAVAAAAASTTFINGQNYAGETLQVYGDIPSGWQAYNGGAVGLVIGTSCVNIGSQAFEYTNIGETIVIPKSVLNIESNAFFSVMITSLVLQEPLQTIGDYAFGGASGLSGTVVIPSTVTSVGDYAFYYCSSLTSIDCYVTRDIMNSTGALDSSGVTTIAVRASDNTWTAGADTIGGKAVTVVKNL